MIAKFIHIIFEFTFAIYFDISAYSFRNNFLQCCRRNIVCIHQILKAGFSTNTNIRVVNYVFYLIHSINNMCVQ